MHVLSNLRGGSTVMGALMNEVKNERGEPRRHSRPLSSVSCDLSRSVSLLTMNIAVVSMACCPLRSLRRPWDFAGRRIRLTWVEEMSGLVGFEHGLYKAHNSDVWPQSDIWGRGAIQMLRVSSDRTAAPFNECTQVSPNDKQTPFRVFNLLCAGEHHA